MWLHRLKENRVLVIFIHGIFGGRWSTWKKLVDALQGRIIGSYAEGSRKGNLTTFDVYCWQYRSTLLNQPPLMPEIIDKFDALLTGLNSHGRYTSIVLVCHSQGGVIAKSFVLEKLANQRGLDLRIDRIITLGTPHLGPRLPLNILFSLIHLVKQVPIVSAIIPFNQLGQLAFISGVMKKLRSHWNTDSISRDPIPASPAQRHIRSLTLQKKRDWFVSRRSACGFNCDTRTPSPGSHFVNVKDLDWIMMELEDHMYPEDALAEIEDIENSAARFDAYVDTFAQPVSEIILEMYPDYDQETLERRTSVILSEFLELFPQNPIRGLQWPEELFEFTRQRLGAFHA